MYILRLSYLDFNVVLLYIASFVIMFLFSPCAALSGSGIR